jgi:Chaperone of endosialidase
VFLSKETNMADQPNFSDIGQLSLQDRNDLSVALREMEERKNVRASVSGELARTAPQGEQDLVARLAGTFGPPVTDAAAQLGPWDTGRISFASGVAVGANANLALHQNGAFNFSGHAHVSGAISYNFSLPATVYVFATNGRLHGTFESGSRDHDWGRSEINPALAAGWAALERGWSWRWQARVNADFGVFLDQIVKAVAAGQAVGSVVKLIASDIRLKRDIDLLGRRGDGLGIYRYRYLWSDTAYVGVMAQEVAEIAPEAVQRGSDGFLRVDYGRLGLQLRTAEGCAA